MIERRFNRTLRAVIVAPALAVPLAVAAPAPAPTDQWPEQLRRRAEKPAGK